MRSRVLSWLLVLCLVAAGCGRGSKQPAGSSGRSQESARAPDSAAAPQGRDKEPLDRVQDGMTVAEVQEILGGKMGEPSTPATVDRGLVEAFNLPKGAKPEDLKFGPCVSQDGKLCSVVFFEGKVVAVLK